jgi:hypothetical protein
MEKPTPSIPDRRTIHVCLSAEAFEILEKFRGGLSVDEFFSALLRLVDSCPRDSSSKASRSDKDA